MEPTRATAPATTHRSTRCSPGEGRDQVRRSLPLPDGITGIVTSPVLRARQTAVEITRVTSLPITTTSLLAEWRAPSIVLGHPDTYPPAYRVWREHRLADPSLRCGDGERRETHGRSPNAVLSSTYPVHQADDRHTHRSRTQQAGY
ncbi:histidine phosphatase family protein [Streptomyces sp. NPDC047070]|uniref:histidine phosphatase family protein n=1 Tax=Streptomyces sp. NPDC047070 TaxID=3154923 RepID=UPI0034570AA0